MGFLLFFPPIPIAIAVLAYAYQLRASERFRTGGGRLVRTLRGTLHALGVSLLGFTCARFLEITAVLHPPWLGLACGAACAIVTFGASLTFADKAIDYALAMLFADSSDAEHLALREIARLEAPDTVAFSALILLWTLIELGAG
jgi:hypothetical protein